MSSPWPFVGRSAELRQIETAMRERDGVVLVGDAGVGKTRLAYEAVGAVDPRRTLGLWFPATAAMTSIPFGALAQGLPSVPESVSPAELLRRIADALTSRAGARRLVLGIDDAHLLDELSAALVHQLAQAGRAFVLVTVRAGESVPPAITALWKEDRAARLEIRAMTHEDVREVLAAVLGGPVDGVTSRRMFEHTRGNMLLLRELVNAGRESGALTEIAGVWQWTGPWVVAPRLAEVIAERIGRLEPDEQEVLEFVAYGEPVGADILVGLTSQRAVLAAESKNLLWTRQDGRRVDVRAGHPLYSEVIRARLPPLRARIVRQKLADAVAATGARRRDDWIRIAIWRLDASLPIEPDVLTAAARQAFAALELPLAERLSRAALDAGADVAGGEVLWRILFLTGRPAEAEEVMAQAAGAPMSDGQRGDWAIGRAYNLFWGLHRIDAAHEVLRETRAVLGDRAWQDEIDFLHCVFDLLSGQPRKSLEATTRLAARPDLSPRVGAQRLLSEGMALVQLGRSAEAAQRLDDLEDELALCAQIPWVQESRALYRCYADLFAGRLDEAGARAEQFYAHAVDTQWDFPLILSCGALAQVARLRGRVRTAASWAREGRALAAKQVSAMFRAHVIGEAAHAEALAGNPAAAAEALAQADELRSPAEGLLQPWTELARPWVAAAAGDTGRAGELALAAAGFCRAQGAPVFEAFALHDAARVGRPGDVAERLHELAADTESEFPRVFADHVAAMLGPDPAALAEVGQRFADLGTDLLAAEACAQAARAFRAAGDPATGRRLHTQAMLTLSGCETATTPLVAEITRLQLTTREREVARLAAAGLSNQDIADRLVLSVRTVGNHLYRLYPKLGVTDRTGLAGLSFPQQPDC
ncbi:MULTISPECIES: LuxR C-terminal-related transcriptional regulator [unclassified Amycolatopsis]|uniref:helix-turn-helix transcriptional regulator n=1 Tax=unclassified Amycolatopsis TaxID=2618356 RepID=UPI002874AF9C|nr:MULTISPECIES: LuxR C-terminal-related transcriptional regulator [unclassified Amycolatopsis]MDS0134324.1 hypothetical protein [Amycolatopsis sp. 505]MDS0148908.1 hypothetical protein [Amycolatopsis sp. CM201R]